MGSKSHRHEEVDEPSTHAPVGLPVDQLYLRCFLEDLEEGERNYLNTLQLGEPKSLHYFRVTESGDTGRITRVAAVLFSTVFILFRYRSPDSLYPWDSGTKRPCSDVRAKESLLIYCYLYPRHIKEISETKNGIFPSLLPLTFQDLDWSATDFGWVKRGPLRFSCWNPSQQHLQQHSLTRI